MNKITLLCMLFVCSLSVLFIGCSFSSCGNGKCDAKETCATCPKDCLPTNQVCCTGAAFLGTCCDNSNCTLPQVCINHNCQIADSCSDSDGGKEPKIQGDVSGYKDNQQYTYSDICLGTTLEEYYCSGTDVMSTNISCSENYTGCRNGACTYCGDGICNGNENCATCSHDCLKQNQVCCNNSIVYNGTCCSNAQCTTDRTCVNHICKLSDTCKDSDYGLVPVVLGTVSGYKDSVNYSYTDVCDDSSMLKEYYCNGTHALSRLILCTGNYIGCSDGICLAAVCGDDVCNGLENCGNCPDDCSVSGEVCCNSRLYNGTCCNSSDCTASQSCVNYVCQTLDSCTDSDGGQDTTVKGIVSGYYNNVTYSATDYCLTSDTVREYYCDGNDQAETDISCISNTTTLCTEGYCAN